MHGILFCVFLCEALKLKQEIQAEARVVQHVCLHNVTLIGFG